MRLEARIAAGKEANESNGLNEETSSSSASYGKDDDYNSADEVETNLENHGANVIIGKTTNGKVLSKEETIDSTEEYVNQLVSCMESVALDWQSFRNSKECRTCFYIFNESNARFHCWACGQIFCIRCIKKKMILPGHRLNQQQLTSEKTDQQSESSSGKLTNQQDDSSSGPEQSTNHKHYDNNKQSTVDVNDYNDSVFNDPLGVNLPTAETINTINKSSSSSITTKQQQVVTNENTINESTVIQMDEKKVPVCLNCFKNITSGHSMDYNN